MPLHRFDHARAAEGVAQLEKDGETIVSISTDDSGVYVATSVKRRKAGEVETR